METADALNEEMTKRGFALVHQVMSHTLVKSGVNAPPGEQPQQASLTLFFQPLFYFGKEK